LVFVDDKVVCDRCDQEYPVGDDLILELVDPATLDPEKQRELQGNTKEWTASRVGAMILSGMVDVRDVYYVRSRMRSIRWLSRYLDRIPSDQIISLGSGQGGEIRYLLYSRAFDRVLCSDLSLTALQGIQYGLERFDLEVGLFTSDLDACPVKTKDVPILIVNALHHTPDLHGALERLLGVGYENILLVEPTTNFFLRLLEGRGVSRRTEYSGVEPGRLELPKLRASSRAHGYTVKVTAGWAIPEDYYRKLFGGSRRVERAVLTLVDLFSAVTNVFQFGNYSVVHLSKR
jgi:hypothetical protein